MDHTVWQDPELAKWYLEGVRGAIPLAAEQIDVMLRVVGACEGSVERVLDLGCGGGTLGAALGEAYPGAEVWMVDFSEAMLESAQSNSGAAGAARHFILADYSEPGWRVEHAIVGPFDVIVSGFSIHHQPDERKRSLYRETHDMLRPGGVFINLEHVSSATPWFTQQFDELFIDALYRHFHAAGSTESREKIADTYYHRDDKDANILAPVETQCDWLRKIGFEDVDCVFKLYEIALFCGRRPA